jgi:hypothetical protein
MAKRQRRAYMKNYMKKYRAAQQQDDLLVYDASSDSEADEIRIHSTESESDANNISSVLHNDDFNEANNVYNTNEIIHTDIDSSSQLNSDNTCDDSKDALQCQPVCKFLSEIGKCALKYKIPREGLNELLRLLRNSGRFHPDDIPKDCRKILKTPRYVNSVDKCGGQYVYVGIRQFISSILRSSGLQFPTEKSHILIDINIDGLPIKSSSNLQLWPILGRIVDINSQPYPIALFSGTGKPNDVNLFLDDFVSELKLLFEGFSLNGRLFTVGIRAFLCDAPARAFVKCVSGHTSKHGCERCTAVGMCVERRIVFLDKNGVLRNDDGFRSNSYPNHVIGLSRLLDLPQLDIIKSFALDVMHLVFLGVCKRFLTFLKSGPRAVKLSQHHLNVMSAKLVDIARYTPSDFARRPRSFAELLRWKATEYRQFTLYTGIVVLKGVLNNELYMLFVVFSTSMRILHLSDNVKRNSYLDGVRELLRAFVHNAEVLLGQIFITYNVHSLMHIVDDVQHFNTSLADLSCFPYENYLHQLKLLVEHTHKHPLASAVKRLQERLHLNVDSPLQSRTIQVSAHRRDSFFVSTSGDYCQVIKVLDDENLYCSVIDHRRLNSFFQNPIDSREFGILYCERITNVTKRRLSLKKADIYQKLYVMHYMDDGCVFIPVLSGTC